MSCKRDTIKLTIDVSIKQHAYITMLAAEKGVSLDEFIIECLPSPDKEFDRLLQEFLVEKAPMLKRLSKK